jgi:hypothetical protein
MTTEIKPSNHNIDATEVQIAYLNELAVANSRYRGALESLNSSLERELKGQSFWGLPHQTLHEVAKFEGALDAILRMKWLLYTEMKDTTTEEIEAHQLKVKEWLKLALERNTHGLFNANQFFPIRK